MSGAFYITSSNIFASLLAFSLWGVFCLVFLLKEKNTLFSLWRRPRKESIQTGTASQSAAHTHALKPALFAPFDSCQIRLEEFIVFCTVLIEG